MSEADKPGQIDRLDSIQDVERLLLEAASAIQRLVSERDELRRRVEILESETTSLRERTLLMQESYRRLTTEFVTQLQLLDTGANDLFREPAGVESLHSKETSPADSS